MSTIRVVALCVFRRGRSILVGTGFDKVKRERFLRPIGGSVEFGEGTAEAIRREIREEMRVEVTSIVRIGVLESVFTCEGKAGHECVFVFDAQFVDRTLYDLDAVPLYEECWGDNAIWLDLTAPIDAPLYPEGLRELLAAAV